MRVKIRLWQNQETVSEEYHKIKSSINSKTIMKHAQDIVTKKNENLGEGVAPFVLLSVKAFLDDEALTPKEPRKKWD